MNNDCVTKVHFRSERMMPGVSQEDALRRTTHLGIGAHQDDLEIMSMHGILECLNRKDLWYSGITCTDGRGSSRANEFAKYSDDEMCEVRQDEQNQAAQLGNYSIMVQLGYKSNQVKKVKQASNLKKDLANYLLKMRPDVIYTHNIFDKHPTHVAVTLNVIEVLNNISKEYRPKQFLGCEVWRNLDWVSDKKKIALKIDKNNEEFVLKMISIFKSQIAGGKRYDLATVGRMRANATYFESHSIDQANLITYAIDLMPLLSSIQLTDYISHYLDSFKEEVSGVVSTSLAS